MANEIKVLKSNTLEQWRQKTNEVSFDIGDNSGLDTTRLNDKVFTYTATTANGGKFIGDDSNNDSLLFSILPDVTIDNTGGYIILKDSTAIPGSFATGSTLAQSGGYGCTLEAISVVDGKPKLLVKNSSGTFNPGQDLTDGTGTIGNANILRIIAESYQVGSVRVLKGSTELTQDLSANGFHTIPLAGLVPLLNSPDISEYHEGDFVYQGGSVNTATWSGTLYHASSTQLLFKTVTGTFNASTLIKNSSTSDTIAGSNHDNITNYAVDGYGIELNIPASNTNVVSIITTDLVDAVNELQDDIGTVESLTQGSADLVTAINDHESDIGNMTLTGLSANNLSAAARELRTELGDVTEINDAAGYNATTSVGGIKEIQGDIGNVAGLNTSHDTTLVGAINEIEGVFDASAHEISAGTTAFTINSGAFTINSSGDIVLDADGADVLLKDNGTLYGSLTNSAGNLVIKSGSTTMLTGSGANATFAGTVTAVGTSVFTNLDISGNVDIDGTLDLDKDKLKIGGVAVTTTAAELNILDGATLSTSQLNILDGATLSTSELNILDGVTASATDINLLDDITNGTVIANKAIITDSNKDIAGGRNITISGELDAATLDISGNADIDGSLALGSLTNVETSITDLQSDVGSNNFTGGTLLNSLGGTSSLTVAIKTLESEIGEDADYASGTITYGAGTISGVLVNLNNELDALNGLTLTAGAGLSGGGTLAANRTFAVNVDNSSIEIDSDTLRVKGGGITNGMLAGGITNTKITNNTIQNIKLANSTITISAETGTAHAIALGETLTVSAGAGINTNITNNTLTISGELATETNAGIATFDGTDFTVSGAGDVTLKSERIQDIVAQGIVSNGSHSGISAVYDDAGNGIDLSVNNTVLRTTGNQTIEGTKTVTGTFDFSGGTVVFGSGGSVQDFNTAFINLGADTNQSGLRIDRSANTNASQTTSVDSEFFWDETLVGSGNNNTSHRGWRVKGFTNASTPLANTSDVVTFYNAKDLISSANSSGISINWSLDTTTAGEHQGIFDLDVNVDNTTIEIATDSLRVKNSGITTSKLANLAVTNAKIVNDTITNAKLANKGISIDAQVGTTHLINLGETLTVNGSSNEIETSINNNVLTIGLPNDVTIGNDLTITGDLIVNGTTTTISSTEVEIEDKNILLGKGSTSSSASNTTGITFGEYSGAATFTYSHIGTKLVSNKPIQASSFTGNLTGNADTATTATTLATGRNFSITGDITASTVSFNGSGAVQLNASIDANTVGASELKVGSNGTNGQVLKSDGDGTFSWVTKDNYGSWTASDGAGTPTSYTITSGDTLSFIDTAQIEPRFHANDQLKFNIVSNSIGITQLDLADGDPGQVLQTDGSGNLSFGSVSTVNNYVSSASFNTGNGVLTLNRSGLAALTVDLDGRYTTTDTNTVTRVREDSGAYRTGDLTLQSGTNVTITEPSTGVFRISSTDTNTNTTYTAGTGLNLTGTTFKANLISDTAQTIAANSATSISNRTYAIQADNDGDLVVNIPWSDTNTTYTTATSGTLGLVKIGYSENGKNYPVELSNGQMYVNVPWVDTDVNTQRAIHDVPENGATTTSISSNWAFDNVKTSVPIGAVFTDTTYTTATSGTLGLVKIGYSENGKNYPVELASGKAYVNVPWVDTNTTYAKATANTLGLIEVGYSQNGKNYPVVLNGNDAYVNVPWTDTNDNTTDWRVADNAGTEKIIVSAAEQVRFVGAGGTTIAFETTPQRITVTSTDTNNIDYINDATFNTSNGVITGTGVGDAGFTVDIDGRYLQSVSLGTTHNQSNVIITNDSGSNATINAATTSNAGVMTKDDKVKLNSLAVSAILSNGSLPSLNSGISAAEVRSVIGAGTSSSDTTYSNGTGLDLSGTTFSLSTDQRRSSYSGDIYLGHAHAAAKSYIKLHSAVASGDTAYIDFYTSATSSSNPTHEFRMADNGDFHADGDVIAYSSTTASDIKLKENIQKVEGALELVSQLDGVTFDWKDKERGSSSGVIAQNVEEVLPTAVKDVETLGSDETHKVVDYNQLSALFIEAIKELKEENKSLRDEIQKLINKE